MVRSAIVIALTACLVIGTQAQLLQDRSKQAFLRPLLEFLDKANLSASLEFSGRCTSLDASEFPEFPVLRKPAEAQGSNLEVIREMFAGDPDIDVTQDPDGMIRIAQHNVEKDLLDIWISRIPFETGQPPAQHYIYDPNAALTHVFAAPEVRRFMKAYDIQRPYHSTPVDILVGKAEIPSAPHVSGPWENITVSGALDHILKSFPGIWIYENCPARDNKERTVYIRFYHLKKTGAESIVQ